MSCVMERYNLVKAPRGAHPQALGVVYRAISTGSLWSPTIWETCWMKHCRLWTRKVRPPASPSRTPSNGQGRNDLPLERLRFLRNDTRPDAGMEPSPWSAGYALARQLRHNLELDDGPIPTLKSLAEAIGEDLAVLRKATRPGSPCRSRAAANHELGILRASARSTSSSTASSLVPRSSARNLSTR